MAVRPLLHHNNLLLFNFKPLLLFSNSPSFLPNSLSSSFSLLSQPSPPCIPITTATRPRVSTAPVEYAPPAPEFDFHLEIARLKALRSSLSNSTSLRERIKVIDSDSRVRFFFHARKNRFVTFLESLNFDEHQVYLLKCVVAAGQEHLLLGGEFEVGRGLGYGEEDIKALRSLLKTLGEVEQFYDCIGGIIG